MDLGTVTTSYIADICSKYGLHQLAYYIANRCHGAMGYIIAVIGLDAAGAMGYTQPRLDYAKYKVIA